MLQLAPMEGITTYIYRNALERHFGCIDCYYTPFLSLHREKEFNHKEKQEILPENNTGIRVIPQVLTNSAQDFKRAEEKIRALGYEEININMGCPSGTVTAKAKGAGMLEDRRRLECFLEEIFQSPSVKISIKTRLGMEDAGEWAALLEIFNRYPISELIVHARVREDFYGNTPNLEAFSLALEQSRNPVCYNGDIFSAEDYYALKKRFPALKSVMLGRGIIANPALAAEIMGSAAMTAKHLRAFHDELYAGYGAIMSGERNVLFKMKELWHYMVQLWQEPEKHEKRLRKAARCAEYETIVNELFENAPFR